MGNMLKIWYGVYFSGEDAGKPVLPEWVRGLLEAGEDTALESDLLLNGYQGADLGWVYADNHYGLAIRESVQGIDAMAVELTSYPENIADVWAADIARALTILGIGDGAKITWFKTGQS